MSALKVFLVFWILAQLAPAQAPTFDLHRHVEITLCTPECNTEKMSSEAVHLDLEKFSGKGDGWDAWDRTRNEIGDTVFKTEIHVVKHRRPEKFQYYIYAVVRTNNREGKILRWNLKNLKEFKERSLEDAPFAIEGGTMQMKLVLGPTE